MVEHRATAILRNVGMVGTPDEMRAAGVPCTCGLRAQLNEPVASEDFPGAVIVGYFPGCPWHGATNPARADRRLIYRVKAGRAVA